MECSSRPTDTLPGRFNSLSGSLECTCDSLRCDFAPCTGGWLLCPTSSLRSLSTTHADFTAQLKHTILSLYRAGSRDASFRALARRFAVEGGGQTIQKWHQQWDGTPQSLETRPRTGRPRVLSAERYSSTCVHPSSAPTVRTRRCIIRHCSQRCERKQASSALRTLQDYGRKELGVKHRRGKKRTADESE